jgi:hypothetical protein
MSNWITNTVMVTGPAHEIDRFIQLVGDDEARFCCARIIPPPEIHGAENVRKWCVGNWGTKRDVWEVEWHRGCSYAFYQFESATGPPAFVFKRLVEEFPDPSRLSGPGTTSKGACTGT